MIKMIIMDVDGTLTDGKIYIGKNGELMKSFNAKDGLGIVNAKKNQIIPVIITGRKSKIVLKRAKELGINLVYQNVKDKLQKLKEILNDQKLKVEDIAYIGDDDNDLEIMEFCGFKACPSDASKNVKEICNYVSNFNGGNGAVREIIDIIMEKNAKE